MTTSREDAPLNVAVEDGQLVIRMGINTLAWAFDHMDSNNPFVVRANNWIQQWRVSDPQEFAKDVRYALCDEAEDGSTPLILFLDKIMNEAADQGSLGIEECTRVFKKNEEMKGNPQDVSEAHRIKDQP